MGVFKDWRLQTKRIAVEQGVETKTPLQNVPPIVLEAQAVSGWHLSALRAQPVTRLLVLKTLVPSNLGTGLGLQEWPAGRGFNRAGCGSRYGRQAT